MWPAIRHGQTLVVRPVAPSPPADGDVVLALWRGIPDVIRMAAAEGDLTFTADADPEPPRPLMAADVLGRIERAERRGARNRSVARIWLDVREAVVAGPDSADDPASTVREKYDDQAVHYLRVESDPIDPSLRARLLATVPPEARILVAGSGSGREVFALEQLGYEVSGVDFSPRMVATARTEAARRGSSATFAAADLRSHDEPVGSLRAVVFTYDVYSFVPRTRDRIAFLTRLRTWLSPGGVVFLSARRIGGLWARTVLSVQWLARAARGRAGEWGDSHTRWLDASGRVRRSFVRVFTDARLDREAGAAGLRRVAWDDGHGLFAPWHDAAGEGRG
jgi:SAM-dependent methyltransferase